MKYGMKYVLAITFGVLLGVGASCVKKGADSAVADAAVVAPEAAPAVDGGVVAEAAPVVAPAVIAPAPESAPAVVAPAVVAPAQTVAPAAK